MPRTCPSDLWCIGMVYVGSGARVLVVHGVKKDRFTHCFRLLGRCLTIIWISIITRRQAHLIHFWFRTNGGLEGGEEFVREVALATWSPYVS